MLIFIGWQNRSTQPVLTRPDVSQAEKYGWDGPALFKEMS